MTISYGLLGERLTHSFSPRIHRLLGDYDYQLIEIAPADLAIFLQQRNFQGLNVTIPYKKSVMPYCDALSPQAKRIGSVNTLVFDDAGRLVGHNTDYDGFKLMVQSSGIDMQGAKVLILGSGGASLTASIVSADLGARSIITVSRNGEVNYHNVYQLHADADIIINATPCGMYPHNNEIPLNVNAFPACRGVLDMIYNPLRTNLALSANKQHIPACCGLTMLVEQARRSAELFLGTPIAAERTAIINRQLSLELENIVLIGMPGSGKSSIGSALARRLQRKFVDFDLYISQKTGSTPEEIIVTQGEEAFRIIESEAALEIGKQQGLVIATGGGTVTKAANMLALKQNGQIYFIERALELLATDGRPLSAEGAALAYLYQQRLPLYQQYADAVIANNDTLQQVTQEILTLFQGGKNENIGY
ncbi:MAG: shikimate kinase [Firmicutes bacterium]|nr:shikimate kinase [Bacillota bacterium]